jgi:hypothetical protein
MCARRGRPSRPLRLAAPRPTGTTKHPITETRPSLVVVRTPPHPRGEHPRRVMVFLPDNRVNGDLRSSLRANH